MYSCQSPVKPYAGVTSAVDANLSKDNKVPISLNGLFGESAGFDDLSSASLATQSLVNCSLLQNKSSTTPSKSPNTILSYSAQPVLLSELAECPPHNGFGPRTCYGTTLCSYISPYDNSRCTNMTTTPTLGIGKSLCPNHLEVLRLNQASEQSSSFQCGGTNDANLSCSSSFSTTHFPTNSPHYVTSNTSSQHVTGTIKSIAAGRQDEDVVAKRNNNAALMTSSLKNIDVIGAQVITNLTPSINSNLILPMSYVNAANHIPGVKSKKSKSKLSQKLGAHIESPQTVPITTSYYSAVNSAGAISSNALRSRGGSTVDGDVLQAFVDFLNQNHHHMTVKQQIDLLTSLGVAVETVNSPSHFPPPHQTLISSTQVTNTKLLPAVASSCSNDTQFQLTKQSSLNRVTSGYKSSQTPLGRAMHSPALNSKRKNPYVEEHCNSKKPKSSNPVNNHKCLQQLSSTELDEHISEALASMRCLPAGNHVVNNLPTANKPKPLASSCNLPNWKRVLPSLPSLPIPMNPNCCITDESISNEALKEYVALYNANALKKQDLFSIGPFCDDKDFCICSCFSNQNMSCNIHTLKPKSPRKIKACAKCQNLDLRHPYAQASDNVLRSISCVWNSGFEGSSSSSENVKLLERTGLKTTPENEKQDVTCALPSVVVARTHCQHLGKSAKMWKKLYKKEKSAIGLLVGAASSNMNETAKTLKKMGVPPISLSRRRGVCASNPSQCSLTDRTGDRCANISLPMSPYCRDHIWHSDKQQLYKLGADMNVVADMYPDPPAVRQRKKTKPPPLTKKKRRNRKGKLVKHSKSTNSNSIQTNPMPDLKLFGANVKSAEKYCQRVIPDSAMEDNNFDLVDSNTSHMSDVMNDPSMSQKINILNENLPISVDEESNSGMFEAFSIDGSELLNDVMPDMFSELGLFNGKNGEVLDNALLLAGAVDPDNPDKANTEKLSFDNFNDNGMLFTGNMSEKDLQTSSASVDAGQSSSGAFGMGTLYNNCPESSAFSTVTSDYLPESLPALNHIYDPLNCGSVSSSISNCETSNTGSVDKWFNSQFGGDTQLDVGEKQCDLESSFADDLDELQGVIQSLQDETDKDNSQTSSSVSQSMISSEEYTNSLAKELSLEIENQAFGFSDSESYQISSHSGESCWNKEQESIAREATVSPSCTTTKPSLSIASQTTFIDNPTDNSLSPSLVPPLHRRQSSAMTTQLKVGDQAKVYQRSKPIKKARVKLNPNKQANSTNTPGHHKTHAKDGEIIIEGSVTSTSDCAKVSAVSSLNNSKNIVDHEKTRSGKRSRCTVPVPGFLPSATQPLVALSSSFRTHPKLMSNTVICAAGKMNSNLNNQSMVLIPVNAVFRTGTQATIQAGNQGVGLAFAIPAQSNFPNSVGTVIPVRGSAVLSGSTNSHQLIIFSGNQTMNTPICTSVAVTHRPPPGATATTTQVNETAGRGLDPSQSLTRHSTVTSSNPSSLVSSNICVSGKVEHNIQLNKQTKLIHAKPFTSRFPTLDQASSANLPLKNKTNLKGQSPIVIPPTAAAHNPAVVMAKPVLTATTDVYKTQTIKSPPLGKSGTVHWDQSMTGPDTPTPQPRLYGSVGGQTSNMLYCRRISPCLNNAQQVVVGRLGSLGRMGLPRVTVADSSNRRDRLSTSNHTLIEQEGTETSDILSSSVAKERKTNASSSMSPVANAFIPLSPTIERLTDKRSSAGVSTNDASGSNLDGSATKRDQGLCQIIKVTDARDDALVNSPSQSTAKCGSRNNCKLSTINDSSLSGCRNNTSTAPLSSPRHNCRKSDHTTTLEDPDFCESPTKIMNSQMIDAEGAPDETCSSNSVSSSHVNIFNVTSVPSLHNKTLHNGGKPRRTSILRKR